MTDPDAPPDDPLHDARHRLKTPLAVILARAQLLARAVRRSPALADEERARMLAGLAAIEAAVHGAAAEVDALGTGGFAAEDRVAEDERADCRH